MVRYYFDLQEGDTFVGDDEGTELLDIAEAQIEAADFLADMAKDLSMRIPDPPDTQCPLKFAIKTVRYFCSALHLLDALNECSSCLLWYRQPSKRILGPPE